MREAALEVAARDDLPDALVITNEEQTARDVLLAAERRGLRTLLIATDLTGMHAEEIGAPRERLRSFAGSLTPDNVAAGRDLAAALVRAAAALPGRAAGDRVGVLALGADEMTPASVDRVEGLQSALRMAASGAALDRLVYARWSETEARTLAGRHMDWARRAGRLPRAVWGASDAMALGAAAALREAGLAPGHDFACGGVNWSADAVQAVTAGRMALTVGGHFLCGAWGLVALRDMADGHDFAGASGARLRLPLSAITSANAARYAEVLGTGDWRRIDFARFLRSARGGAPYDFSLDAVLAASGG